MNANLVLLKKNGTRKTFPLPGTVTVVGRQQECDLCIPLMVISRKHCEINQDGGVLRVRDLGSRNGTLVNGKKIVEAVLNPGDTLQIGPVSFGIQLDGVPAELSNPQAEVPGGATTEATSQYQPGDAIESSTGTEKAGAADDDDILEIMETFAEDDDEDKPAP